MMKLLFLMMFLFSVNAFADGGSAGHLKHLPEKYAKKITKADKLLTKGNEILKEALEYDEQITAKEADGKKRKVKKLKKKSLKIKLKAAPFLEDGYKKKVKVYQKLLSDAKKENPQLASRIKEIEVKSKKKIKQAKKLYRKADDASSRSKSAEYFEIGHKTISEAVKQLEEGLELVYGEDKEEKNKETKDIREDSADGPAGTTADVEADEVPEQTQEVTVAESTGTGVTAASVAAGTAVAAVSDKQENTSSGESGTEQAAQDVTESVQETVKPEAAVAAVTTAVPVSVTDSASVEVVKKPEAAGDVFFTIQIIADSKPVPEELLKSKYSGSREIIKMEADGWYRYSVGRFTSLQQAKDVMQNENIKGFIVAYNNGQRITFKEANELLKQNQEQ